MKYSLRFLLALLVSSAMAFALVHSHHELRTTQIEFSIVEQELITLRKWLKVDDEVFHTIRRQHEDQIRPLENLAGMSDKKLNEIVERHGKVKVVGDDVVSIRTVPTPRKSLGIDRTRIRIHIPASRSAWLNYRLFEIDLSDRNPRQSERVKLAEPGGPVRFDHLGPFELRLNPGSHLLSITTSSERKDEVKLLIELDGNTLLQTVARQKELTALLQNSIGCIDQIDFGRGRQLPCVFDQKLHVRKAAKAFVFSLGLREKPGGHDFFPGSSP